MDIATYDRETAVHRRLYEAQRERVRTEYAGKYIALAGGQLIVAATFNEAKAAVEELCPDSEYSLIFPAEMDPPFELSLEI